MIIKHAKVIGIAACLLVASLANAQVEYAWKVIATHPSAQSITAYQGETIDLKPALYSYNNLVTNITSATFYWQTNGMETAWWSKPAEISAGQITATFAPTNDFGAAAYTFFIRASSGSGASYRANGTLRMLDSPGHSPAAAVDPAAYGTLAQDIAPWVLAVLPEYETAGAALAVSNTLASAISGNTAAIATHTNNTDNPHDVNLADAAVAGGFAGTETITPLNIVMGGYWQAVVLSGGESTIDSTAAGASQSGENVGTQSIGNYAYGASQSGRNSGERSIGNYAYGASQSGNNYYGTQSIGAGAHGASQSGANEGTQSIGEDAHGASQSGENVGTQSIGNSALGASQRGYNVGTQSIGEGAYGASQSGYNFGGNQSIGEGAYGATQAGRVGNQATATNNAVGAMQLFDLTEGQAALTTPGGKGSLLLGAGVASNKNSIVVGDGNASHGDGSVTANSFWQNNIRMATIDDIPTVPTNSVVGWLVYDSGSNIWLNVTVSNLNFEVYEVEL